MCVEGSMMKKHQRLGIDVVGMGSTGNSLCSIPPVEGRWKMMACCVEEEIDGKLNDFKIGKWKAIVSYGQNNLGIDCGKVKPKPTVKV